MKTVFRKVVESVKRLFHVETDTVIIAKSVINKNGKKKAKIDEDTKKQLTELIDCESAHIRECNNTMRHVQEVHRHATEKKNKSLSAIYRIEDEYKNMTGEHLR